MENPTPASSPTLEIDDRGIGWVTFDDPDRPVNVLSGPVMRRLADVVDQVREAAEAGRVLVVVFRSGKPDSFIVGADVEAIASIEDPSVAETAIRLGQAVFMDVETLPVPTVAAIHGVCLGGGLELALACTHRAASDSKRTRLGCPEVQLGILPAWGGTTRLPRLIGLQTALDLLLTGRQIDARRARRIGLVGRVLPAELFPREVTDFALEAIELPRGSSRRKRGLGARLLEDTAPGRLAVLSAARKRVMATTGGHYPAPLRIIEVLRHNLGASVEKSLRAEARAAAELLVSSVCKNLMHVFKLREAARKGIGVGREGVAAREVERMGVLGAGVMGGG
ncbi:MAG TPA: enoyl-CoA hydratase-related protein, partial [Longimicrobiales bacterium]|nr:enoyl-CoA hydratase-related protein [Longimicrobiales bacterium]